MVGEPVASGPPTCRAQQDVHHACCASGPPPFAQVARARQQGQRVIGEPVASGLALNETWMWHPDFDVAARYVMSPPIRGAEHGAALRKVIKTGAYLRGGSMGRRWGR